MELSEAIAAAREVLSLELAKANKTKLAEIFNIIKPENEKRVPSFKNPAVAQQKVDAVLEKTTDLELADIYPVVANSLGVTLGDDIHSSLAAAVEEAVKAAEGREAEEAQMKAAAPSGTDEAAAPSGTAPQKKAAAKKSAAPAPAKKAAFGKAEGPSEAELRTQKVQALLAKGPQAVKEMAKELGMTDQHVRNSIDAMRRVKGPKAVYSHGGGVFGLTAPKK